MQLAFHIGKTKLDRAIQVVTRSPYTHVEMVMSDGMWFTSSHFEKGVVGRKYEPEGVWEYVDVEADEEVARHYLEALVGMPYDYLGVARFVFPGVPHSHDRWFCSELTACTLKVCGRNLKKKPQHYSPGGLHCELLKN